MITNYTKWLVDNGTIATEADAMELLSLYKEERTTELTGKIPVGTECTEDNNCGGFLTAAEVAELEELATLPTVCNDANCNCQRLSKSDTDYK